MNEDRWLRIASSFPSNSESEQGNNLPQKEVKLTKDFLEPRYPYPPPEPQIVDKLTSKVQALEALIQQKSEVILKQASIIKSLQEENKQNSRDKTNFIKLNRQGPLSRKNGAIEEEVVILQHKVLVLESKMTNLITSLPKRISHLCDEHISCKKFQLEETESGESVLVLLNPSSPKTKNKSQTVNVRQTHASKLRQMNGSNPVPGTVTEDVKASVQRLENVVNELKLSFLQILFQRMSVVSMPEKGAKGQKNWPSKEFENLVKGVL